MVTLPRQNKLMQNQIVENELFYLKKVNELYENIKQLNEELIAFLKKENVKLNKKISELSSCPEHIKKSHLDPNDSTNLQFVATKEIPRTKCAFSLSQNPFSPRRKATDLDYTAEKTRLNQSDSTSNPVDIKELPNATCTISLSSSSFTPKQTITKSEFSEPVEMTH